MYELYTQKTYKRKSAYSWLKDAEISKMRAGNFEITHPKLEGYVFLRTDNENLAIHSAEEGAVCILSTSRKAKNLLNELNEKIVHLYDEEYKEL